MVAHKHTRMKPNRVLLLATGRACFRCRLLLTDLQHHFTTLPGDVLELEQEFTESHIVDLAPPQTLHSAQV